MTFICTDCHEGNHCDDKCNCQHRTKWWEGPRTDRRICDLIGIDYS